MKNAWTELISRKAGRPALVLAKNSPNLLFVGGVVGMIGSTVMACRATLKLEEVLNKTQDDLKTANNLEHEEYSDQDRKKDTAIIYTRSAMKVAQLYAPSVLLGSASIAMLSKSHDILTKRNAALTAAYAALDRGFREYRDRVIAKYGEEEDRILRYDTEKIKVRNNETGKDEEITRVGKNAASIYARFFDEGSTSWSKQPEYNALFLRCQQNYANDLLNARGHVFLNEVYDFLGLTRTEAGAIVGWIRSPESDNYIDFGVFSGKDDNAIRDFVNGRERSVLLDFNVDGVIFDKIDTPKESPSWQRS